MKASAERQQHYFVIIVFYELFSKENTKQTVLQNYKKLLLWQYVLEHNYTFSLRASHAIINPYFGVYLLKPNKVMQPLY